MLLIYSDPHAWDTLSPADGQAVHGEYVQFSQAIIDSKEHVGGAPLQGIDTATTVRVREGERVVTDGPFAETKEILGGYYVVDVPDLDRALALAAEVPNAKRSLGSVEVRPLQGMPDMPGTD